MNLPHTLTICLLPTMNHTTPFPAAAAAPTLRCDEAFFALAHLYLELQLPPQWALRAAKADGPWAARPGEPCSTGGNRT